ncbi:hypothetical protein V8E53_004338 [Lactarius tabidus]
MPGGKRDKTPPPPPDEPKYLTIVHPYPLNANLELHADRRTLALWLACCTGKDVLLAMFHKPASRGMVVIEVHRDFDSFDRLLGLHTWSEFLQKPCKEQIDKVSKCSVALLTQVVAGWKRVNIEDRWFNGWTANNSIIRHPYPKTSQCDLPSEAQTGAPMCRPLPQESFPVPPPAPPVGSAGWLAVRNANPSAIPAPSTTRKARTAVPSDTASMTSASSRGARSFLPPPSASSPAPSSVMANYRAKNDVAWKHRPHSIASVASATTSRAPNTVASASVLSARGPPRPPPGLDPRSTTQSRTIERFDLSEDVERHELDQRNNPPARSLAPSLSLSSNPAQRPPYDPDGPVEPSREYEYTEEDQPRYSIFAAMSDIFENDLYLAPPSTGSGRGGTRPPGIDDPDYDPGNAPAEAAEPAIGQPGAVDPAAPWAEYDALRLEPPTKVRKKGQWTCPQHGPLCNPGICKERARFEYDERMRTKREEWEEERIEREANRAKWKEEREKEAEAMGLGGRQRPPHLRRGAPSSSGNKSRSDSDTSRDEDSNAPPSPDQEDWSIPWDTREGTDTQSVVNSARRAWNSVAGGGSRGSSSHPTPPASVISNGRSRGPPVSPRPPTSQSARDARSSTRSASQTPSVVAGSVWPSESGFSSRPPSVSAAGSDNGRRSGTRPATRSDGRSSVSSNARGPASPTSPAASGFPTFADTHWGDPIAMALAAKEDKRDRGGSEAGTGEEGSGGQKASKSAKRRKNKAKGALVQAQAVQASTLEEAVLDVELPAGGPGSSWGDPNEPW